MTGWLACPIPLKKVLNHMGINCSIQGGVVMLTIACSRRSAIIMKIGSERRLLIWSLFQHRHPQTFSWSVKFNNFKLNHSKVPKHHQLYQQSFIRSLKPSGQVVGTGRCKLLLPTPQIMAEESTSYINIILKVNRPFHSCVHSYQAKIYNEAEGDLLVIETSI